MTSLAEIHKNLSQQTPGIAILPLVLWEQL